MQKADVLLSILNQKSISNSEFQFSRVYRNLFNKDIFVLAYNNLLTSNKRYNINLEIDELIRKIKKETYIPETMKNGSRESLGDMLVQEVVRLLLQAIYEPIFFDFSHGYRPGKSCHTALLEIRKMCRGTNWAITGKNIFNSTDTKVLLEVLARKISDGRFLELIKNFIKMGYLEARPSNSIAGFPQVTTICSVLINILLHEFDKYIFKVISQSSVKIRYVRYADEFIVLIAGAKKLADDLQKKVEGFLENKLNLRSDKVLVTNLLDTSVRFLGYELVRTANNNFVQLLVPADIIHEKLKPFTKKTKPIHHSARVNLTVTLILNYYNAEIKNLYCYYSLAEDVGKKVGKFKYYHYYSLLKTVALKERCSILKIIKKYGIEVKMTRQTDTKKVFGLSFANNEGTKTITYFSESLKRRNNPFAGLIANGVNDVITSTND